MQGCMYERGDFRRDEGSFSALHSGMGWDGMNYSGPWKVEKGLTGQGSGGEGEADHVDDRVYEQAVSNRKIS